MTPQFITLPSGLRVNTAHIIHYGESEHSGQIKLVLTDEPTPWLETMTAEQLDALLHSGSPIVEAVVNLDRLRIGNACSFSYGGDVLHGVIHDINYSEPLGEPWVQITSHGQLYTLWPRDGEVDRD